MQTKQHFFHRDRLGRLLLGLALLLTPLLTLNPATPAQAALVWQIQTVDSAGDVGQYTALALDSSGNPVISYFDFTNQDLKLLHCGDATCTSGNSITTVDSAGTIGRYTSLALDSSGNPVISYFDGFPNDNLKLVHCGNPICSSGNTIQTVDSAGNVGQFTSLELDSSGNPVISYSDFTNGDLKLTHCGNPHCSSGNTIQTVDNAPGVGDFISLALDGSGNPVISYFNGASHDLKLAQCGNATCSSGNTIRTLDSVGLVGSHTSLALDNTGNPVISYYNITNQDLKLMHCGNATCSSGNSIQTVDSAGNVGINTSLELDSSGNPIISYYDATNGNLKLMQCGDATCSSGNSIQTVDSAGDVGLYTALKLDSSGNPVISYYDVTNGDLKLARLIDDSTAPIITPTVSGTLGNNDWYTSDVSVSWSVVDNESGISSQSGCDAQSVTADTLGVTFTCTATSPGGTASQSVTITRDATAPAISFTTRTPANGNGWNNGDVTVEWSCSDATSGAVAASVSKTLSGEGSNQSASGVCTDNAGNSASDAQSGINIDKTAPSISAAASSSPNGAGWYNGDVTVQFTCADALAGVASCPADEVLSSEGAAVASTAQTVSDLAGNSSAPSNVVTVQIDKSAPTLNPVVTPNPVTVGGAATVTSGAADALSDIATESCGALDTSTGGVKSVTCTATDNAGNSNSASVNYTVQPAGVLVGACGGYEVYQVGSVYSAAGWSSTIKVGTNGNNTLNGGSGPDLMLGLGGNDLLKGNGGDDLLCGGDGVDLLLGAAGNDLLDGGAGNDVLNGGTGDYDGLLAGDGNDVLLDGDGVVNAAGGAGNDLFTIALRNGWRDGNGQPRFAGLASGYGNDAVGLAILNSVQFFVDITGDGPIGIPDEPASPLEGANDGLALAGVIDPASTIIKFEQQVIVSAAEQMQPSEESGAEYLTEPVGEDGSVLDNTIFLPLVNR